MQSTVHFQNIRFFCPSEYTGCMHTISWEQFFACVCTSVIARSYLGEQYFDVSQKHAKSHSENITFKQRR